MSYILNIKQAIPNLELHRSTIVNQFSDNFVTIRELRLEPAEKIILFPFFFFFFALALYEKYGPLTCLGGPGPRDGKVSLFT